MSDIIYILNAPPRSGKDEFAKAFPEKKVFRFADKIKEMTHKLYGLDVPNDYFEDRKDIPCEEFYGITPRQAYIQFSEYYIKPLYGKRWIGENLGKIAEPDSFVPDCGFGYELDAFLDVVEYECVLIRAHRKGCDFSNDSRNWVYTKRISSIDLYNNGTIEEWHELAREIVRS